MDKTLEALLTKALGKNFEKVTEVGADWMPANQTRPFIWKDPALIWLNYYGSLAGFYPDDPPYSIASFLATKKQRLREKWLAEMAPGAVTVCEGRYDIYHADTCWRRACGCSGASWSFPSPRFGMQRKGCSGSPISSSTRCGCATRSTRADSRSRSCQTACFRSCRRPAGPGQRRRSRARTLRGRQPGLLHEAAIEECDRPGGLQVTGQNSHIHPGPTARLHAGQRLPDRARRGDRAAPCDHTVHARRTAGRGPGKDAATSSSRSS